jgi:predicted DNA-binding transcriptional regulator AlpA
MTLERAEEIRALALELAGLMAAELLTDVQVAALLQIGKSTVWQYANDGKLPKPVRLGAMTRWRRAEVMARINSLEVAA